MKLIIYTDGASRGNPGPASYGFSIQNEKGEILYEEGKYLGQNTNNFAEYSAVLNALLHIKNNFKNISEVNFFMDSKLAVEQLSGRFKIKSPHLKPIIEKILILTMELGGVKFNHVPRSKNMLADKLANQALDKLLLT